MSCPSFGSVSSCTSLIAVRLSARFKTLAISGSLLLLEVLHSLRLDGRAYAGFRAGDLLFRSGLHWTGLHTVPVLVCSSRLTHWSIIGPACADLLGLAKGIGGQEAGGGPTHTNICFSFFPASHPLFSLASAGLKTSIISYLSVRLRCDSPSMQTLCSVTSNIALSAPPTATGTGT